MGASDGRRVSLLSLSRKSSLTAGAVAAVVVVAGALAFLLLHAREARIQTASGDLQSIVNDLVRTMPRQGAGGYQTPTAGQESAMASAFTLITQGHLQDAARVAAPLDYSVVLFTDTPTGRHLVLLEENQKPDGSWPHAWGLYVYSPDTTSPLVVEVAHPFDDIDTPMVGMDIFRAADARALLVAGASRFAVEGGVPDVAHDQYTVFEGINEAVLAAGGSVVVEPHGFENYTGRAYGDVVVSSGSAPPSNLASQLTAALEQAGFRVCLYDGTRCSALAGTTNVQGQFARSVGKQFLQVEISYAVRSDPVRSDAMAQAIARITGR